MENITHFLKTPTENNTSNIEFFICSTECNKMTPKNQTLPKNHFLIEILFVHNYTSLASLRINIHLKDSTKSTIFRIKFENIAAKSSNFELSGPKGYLLHKPIIIRRKDNIVDYLKLPFVNDKILFGENIILNSFSKFNSCEMFRNETIKQLTALKALNVSELGAPNNSSNLWHNIEVDLESIGGSCENLTNEFFFNFEFARSKVDNIPHQNLLKRVFVNTGSLGKIRFLRNGNETGVNIRFGVMFYDLTEITYNSGIGNRQISTLSFIIAFLVVLF